MRTLPLVLFAAFFTFQAGAQITFFRSDWKKNIGETTEIYEAVNSAAVPVPTEGPNQVWDYSGTAFDAGVVFTVDYDPVSLPAIPNANIQRGVASASPIPLVPTLPAKRYLSLDNTSYRTVGGNINPITLPLQSVTGGANDQLAFTGNISAYDSPELIFPMTMGDTWGSTYDFVTDFNLTVAAFGLNNAPGSNIQNVTKNFSVVGYGTLILPNVMGGPPIQHEALMVKEVQTIVESYTLFGAPAPPVLLAAFGLSQGATSQFTTYTFWVKGLEDSALTFENVGSNSVFGVYLLADQNPIAAIPTMSEWGLFLFSLIILTIGLVFIAQPQYRMAMAGTNVFAPVAKFSMSSFPFEKPVFLQALKYAACMGLVGFAFIYLGWGEIVVADLMCMPFAVLLVAYQIHIIMLYKPER